MSESMTRPIHTNHSPAKILGKVALIACGVFLMLTPAVHAQISTELVKVLAFDGAALDEFGYDVASTVNTMIIGADADSDNGLFSGSAYVYSRDANGVWSFQAKLHASDAASGDRFGNSVAISGNTAIVGAPMSFQNGVQKGAAYIFVRDINGVWTEQAKLTIAIGAALDQFGDAVAISGNTALIGAYNNTGNGTGSGSAYIFIRDANGVWSLQTRLWSSSGAFEDRFGLELALEGNTAVIAAPLEDDNGLDSGSIYVYKRAVGIVFWSLQNKLHASDGMAGDHFGHAVAINNGTIFASADLADNPDPSTGAVYVYKKTIFPFPGVWTERAKLLPCDNAAYNYFGSSIALVGDVAIIGSWGNDNNGMSTGATYVFNRNSLGDWSQRNKLIASDGAAGDNLGWSVAIAGTVGIVGAFTTNDNGLRSGSAYIFDLPVLAPPVDFNGDGLVDAADLATLLANWGPCGPAPALCPVDLNCDGFVNAADLAGVLANWGVLP